MFWMQLVDHDRILMGCVKNREWIARPLQHQNIKGQPSKWFSRFLIAVAWPHSCCQHKVAECPFLGPSLFFRSASPGEAFVHQEPGIPESIAFFPAPVTQDLIPCLCSLPPVQCSRTYHFCSFCNRLPLLQCYPGYGLWFKSIRAFCCGFVRPAGHDEGERQINGGFCPPDSPPRWNRAPCQHHLWVGKVLSVCITCTYHCVCMTCTAGTHDGHWRWRMSFLFDCAIKFNIQIFMTQIQNLFCTIAD